VRATSRPSRLTRGSLAARPRVCAPPGERPLSRRGAAVCAPALVFFARVRTPFLEGQMTRTRGAACRCAHASASRRATLTRIPSRPRPSADGFRSRIRRTISFCSRSSSRRRTRRATCARAACAHPSRPSPPPPFFFVRAPSPAEAAVDPTACPERPCCNRSLGPRSPRAPAATCCSTRTSTRRRRTRPRGTRARTSPSCSTRTLSSRSSECF